MPPPIQTTARGLDLSPRVARTSTVVASPTGATITTIASLTITEDLAVGLGVLLFGWAAFTVGTAGVSSLLGIRQTNTTGTIVGAGNAATETAANLDERSVQGFDANPVLPGQVYVLTLTVASANAGSTVSAVSLIALVV